MTPEDMNPQAEQAAAPQVNDPNSGYVANEAAADQLTTPFTSDGNPAPETVTGTVLNSPVTVTATAPEPPAIPMPYARVLYAMEWNDAGVLEILDPSEAPKLIELAQELLDNKTPYRIPRPDRVQLLIDALKQMQPAPANCPDPAPAAAPEIHLAAVVYEGPHCDQAQQVLRDIFGPTMADALPYVHEDDTLYPFCWDGQRNTFDAFAAQLMKSPHSRTCVRGIMPLIGELRDAITDSMTLASLPTLKG